MGRKKNVNESENINEFSYSVEQSKLKHIIRNVLNHEIKTLAKNDSQTALIKSIKNNEVTICSGIAGSGKTFIALSQALRLLKQENTPYTKIYLIKSVTTLDREDLGFLRGDKFEKFEPYMMSYYINIDKIIGKDKRNELLKEEILVPFPLAYIRGVSIDNAIVIVDETQNISIPNIRTILTRIGNNSRMLLIGDEYQIDLRNKNESSLRFLMNIFDKTNNIGVIEMNKNDINVRNPLINIIENIFNDYNDA